MRRTYLATLHYDGSGFVGWQRQSTGRSVQAEVERVLERLFGQRAPAYAAGRTDAGVHAAGMGVSFTAPDSWTPISLHRALNALLPPDCWVAAVQPMREEFQARKSALSRRYRYEVGTDIASASPFRKRYEWALERPLDAHLLRSAAPLLSGAHDFRAFAVKGQEKSHYRCVLSLAEWRPRPEGRGVTFHVEADRFLHHMVRLLVGTMVDIGLGRRPLGDIDMLLERGDNQETSSPAPPQGLYFVAARYPAECYAESDVSSGGVPAAVSGP